MAHKEIYYEAKQTKANTTYCQLRNQDQGWLEGKLVQMLSFMGEVSINSSKEARDYVSWWTKSNRDLPYNMKMGRNNSPQSYVSGIVNNLIFGTQRDLSLKQLEIVQQLILAFESIVQTAETELDRTLQSKADRDTATFRKKFFNQIKGDDNE